MSPTNFVLLFPGQGGYSPGLLSRLSASVEGADEVFRRVQKIGQEDLGIDLSELMTDGQADVADLVETHPDVLQLGIFAGSVALAEAVRKAGVRPTICMGHSFGEIAALTAAGACSTEDGARVVTRRIRALSLLPSSSGSMLAVNSNAAKIKGLSTFLGEEALALAGQNECEQVVLSGTEATVRVAADVLRAAGMRSTRLPSPYPFHSPVLRPVVDAFAASLGDLELSDPEIPVYSPILGRYYDESDSLPACLAEHLVAPFDLYSAVHRVRADGGEIFVECGGRQILTELVSRILADESGWRAVATDEESPSSSRTDEIATLTVTSGRPTSDQLRAVLAPAMRPGEFDSFWNSQRHTVLAAVAEAYSRFLGHAVSDVAPTPSQPVTSDSHTHDLQPATEPRPDANAAAELDRQDVFDDLVQLYSEALEYPPEVFTEDVQLESDLGVDSVKQTDLLTRAAKRYQLPPRPEGFQINEYAGFGQIVDLVAGSVKLETVA